MRPPEFQSDLRLWVQIITAGCRVVILRGIGNQTIPQDISRTLRPASQASQPIACCSD